MVKWKLWGNSHILVSVDGGYESAVTARIVIIKMGGLCF